MWGELPAGARRLPTSERDEALNSSFDVVFADLNPFGTPFTEQVESRAILFPVRYVFDEDQFAALAAAAETIGEGSAYLRLTEVPTADLVELPLEYPIYAAAAQAAPPVERCICSTRGTWGLLFSHEDHVVVGGASAFVEALLDAFPPVRDAPVHFDVTAEMDPWSRSEESITAEPGEDMAEHYERQGARRDPPLIRVSGREQGAAFVAEVRRWRDAYGTAIDWLPAFLSHIYGEADAGQMLERAGLG